MRLDELARGAATELLGQATPDLEAGREALARRRRSRVVEKVAVGAVLAVVVGTGVLVGRGVLDEPSPPEPAAPTIRNGALVSLDLQGTGVVSVVGELAHLPADVEPFTSLQFTPDGRELVFVARDDTVRAFDVVDGSQRRLADCPTPGCLASLSPDGSTLAMSARDGSVLVSTEDGTEVGRVDGWAVSWSPDGTQLAYLGRHGVSVARGDGRNPRELLRYDVGVLSPPAWSPDGQRLALVLSELVGEVDPRVGLGTYDHTLTTVSVLDGVTDRLLDLGRCLCLGVSAPVVTWSPAGDQLAWTRVDVPPNGDQGLVTAGGVYVSDVEGRNARQVFSSAESALAWQPVTR